VANQVDEQRQFRAGFSAFKAQTVHSEGLIGEFKSKASHLRRAPLLHVRGERRRHQQVTQVDNEGGGNNRPGREPLRHQFNRHQLRRASENEERHQQAVESPHAGRGGQHAEGETDGQVSQHHWQGGREPGKRFGERRKKGLILWHGRTG